MNNIKNVSHITLIVTHPGQAHRDDFVSVCLLLAASGAKRVERRNPTEEELADKDVAVVDVGMQHSVRISNLDHHQFRKEERPLCAVDLTWNYLGFSEDTIREVFGWAEFTSVLDCRGPKAAAELLGISQDALFATMSPIEAQLIRIFESETIASPAMVELMRQMGQGWIDYVSKYAECARMLASSVTHDLSGLRVWDYSHIPADQCVVGAVKAHMPSDVAVNILRDGRNGGLALYRVDDHPAVDFARIKDDPRVLFAHNNGFYAALQPTATSADATELIALALDSVVVVS